MFDFFNSAEKSAVYYQRESVITVIIPFSELFGKARMYSKEIAANPMEIGRPAQPHCSPSPQGPVASANKARPVQKPRDCDVHSAALLSHTAFSPHDSAQLFNTSPQATKQLFLNVLSG